MILVLDEDHDSWIRLDVGPDESREVPARAPEAAVDACAAEVGTYQRVAAVPSSSWHEFEKTTAFKKL